MAKKKIEAQEPAISTIPLPSQDSPLVIDLPDGQKLVVGNIAQGTVIEVATWRGTGRPDSRTNRLMLGVSSTEQVENSPSKSESSSPGEESNQKNKFWGTVLNFFNSLFVKKKKNAELDELDAFIAEKEKESLKALGDDSDVQAKKISKDKNSNSRSIIDESEDIQSWLDDLMKSTSEDFARQSEVISTPLTGKVRRVAQKSKTSSGASKRGKKKSPKRRKGSSQASRRAGVPKKKSSTKRGNAKKRKGRS